MKRQKIHSAQCWMCKHYLEGKAYKGERLCRTINRLVTENVKVCDRFKLCTHFFCTKGYGKTRREQMVDVSACVSIRKRKRDKDELCLAIYQNCLINCQAGKMMEWAVAKYGLPERVSIVPAPEVVVQPVEVPKHKRAKIKKRKKIVTRRKI